MPVITIFGYNTAKTKGMTMAKRLSKKKHFFNEINFTADDEVYFGIDVHKASCHIAVWLNNGIALLSGPDLKLTLNS